MKVQTSALIDQIIIGENSCNLSDHQTIELEFSAIDTGGGFKDPILDFSFSIDKSVIVDFDNEDSREITLSLSDPQKSDNEITFAFTGKLKQVDEQYLQANGRLKGDQLSRELIGFVMKRIR